MEQIPHIPEEMIIKFCYLIDKVEKSFKFRPIYKEMDGPKGRFITLLEGLIRLIAKDMIIEC